MLISRKNNRLTKHSGDDIKPTYIFYIVVSNDIVNFQMFELTLLLLMLHLLMISNSSSLRRLFNNKDTSENIPQNIPETNILQIEQYHLKSVGINRHLVDR